MESGKSLRILTIGGIGVVVVAGLAAIFWSGPRKVTMTYVAGPDCVTLDPAVPEIWQEAPGNGLKKKRVKWKVTSSQKKEYYWEIDYDGSGSGGKPSGSGDYLGPIDPIPCNKSSTKSPNVVPDQDQDVEWPYKITVYACDDGAKGDELCVKDPVVWIRR